MVHDGRKRPSDRKSTDRKSSDRKTTDRNSNDGKSHDRSMRTTRGANSAPDRPSTERSGAFRTSTGRPPSERASRDTAHAAHSTGPSRQPKPRGGGSLNSEHFVVGKHAVEATLQYQHGRAERLIVDDEKRSADAIRLARMVGVPVEVKSRHDIDQLVGGDLVAQGVLLKCGPFPFAPLSSVTGHPQALGLVLDGVEDPRNLGAAARAAYALGATFVGITRRNAAQPTASAYKASAGALARVPVVAFDNLKRGLSDLKDAGFWITGAEADGPAFPWDVDFTSKIVIVIGGEDQGMRRLTRETCDHVVSIPMVASDMSLNAADAATVLLYEARRQRQGRPTPTL